MQNEHQPCTKLMPHSGRHNICKESPVIRVAQVAPNIFPVPPQHHGGTERIVHDLSTALRSLNVEVTLFAPSDSATDLPRVGESRVFMLSKNSSERLRRGCPRRSMPCNGKALRLRLDGSTSSIATASSPMRRCSASAVAAALTTVHWRVDELDRALFLRGLPDLPVAAISAAQEAGIPASNRAGVVASRHRGRPLRLSGRTGEARRLRSPDDRPKAAGRRDPRGAGSGDAVSGSGARSMSANRIISSAPCARCSGTTPSIAAPSTMRRRALSCGQRRALLFPIDWPEPFGLVMIEAMACGTPVVAWNRGSVPEIVEEGCDGLRRLFRRGSGRRPRPGRSLDGAAIRARFEARFTAERMARDYLAIYRRLLAA